MHACTHIPQSFQQLSHVSMASDNSESNLLADNTEQLGRSVTEVLVPAILQGISQNPRLAQIGMSGSQAHRRSSSVDGAFSDGNEAMADGNRAILGGNEAVVNSSQAANFGNGANYVGYEPTAPGLGLCVQNPYGGDSFRPWGTHSVPPYPGFMPGWGGYNWEAYPPTHCGPPPGPPGWGVSVSAPDCQGPSGSMPASQVQARG